MLDKDINLERLEAQFIVPNNGQSAPTEDEDYAIYDFPTDQAALLAVQGIRNELGEALTQLWVQNPTSNPTRVVMRKPQSLRSMQIGL